MRTSSVRISILAGGLSVMQACGETNTAGGFQPGGGSGGIGNTGQGGAGAGGGFGNLEPDGGLGGSAGSSSGGGSGVACPAGWECNVSCPGGGTTSITGTVMDPAGADPLWHIVAYVPTQPLGTLPSGVPTGAAACSCSALFQGSPLVYALGDTDGNFTITNAPIGQNIPVVVQVGKWRRQITVNTTRCGATSAGKINLPNKVTNPGDNIPDIAVSTGAADSLECLLVRVGLDASEYVPGWTQTGHVHIFNGGTASTTQTILGVPVTLPGTQEQNAMAGAPDSNAGLWDSTADLMKNDIVLLSCEGSETYDAVPQNLEDYLNAGGRAFASHYHYAWFTGSTQGGYTAPADWGNNLAVWTTGAAANTNNVVNGSVVTTLTAGGTFAKGAALDAWLGNVDALGGTVSGTAVTAGDVGIAEPRFNADVTTQKPSQAWIELDPPSASTAPTLYFSFDTPVSETTEADGGAQYCGRAVFSGLHVGGASYDGVNCSAGAGTGMGSMGEGCNTGHIAAAPPPTGCDTTHPLSPQEKVLEFMLFDLSSCVVPDDVEDAGAGMITPK
jgi:hypothetical protein